MRGKPGTEIKLTISREGEEKPLTITIVRDVIKVASVKHKVLEKDIAYIRISQFQSRTTEDLLKAIKKLRKKLNGKIKGLILDLRNNPGGILNSAVTVSDAFLEDGLIVYTQGASETSKLEFKAAPDDILDGAPIVVLVNQGSASASEIVAGSLQDLDRAVIIGQRTYGKGLVQTTRELSYNSRLKVTTAKYYIPSGRCIQALDYSNRNEDGSVGTIPDSLITEYQTNNGRKVYDGGGIQPDFDIDAQTLSQVAIALVTQSMIFDYATVFASRHDSIAGIADFTITDRIYDNFRDYVGSRDFTYNTKSEESLTKLMETAKREKYFSMAEEEFAALEKKLAHDNEKDFKNFNEEIKQLLKEEIVVRYFYQKGRMQAILEKDTAIDKALEVFTQPNLYLVALGEKSAGIEARSPLLAHPE